MNQQPTTPTSEAVAVGDVYVLTEHMSEGDTVLYITTSLHDAQTFHARNPIRTQVQPWEPVILRSEIDDEPHTWRTRPAGTGGYGAIYYIVKTPLHAPLSIASDILTDALTSTADTTSGDPATPRFGATMSDAEAFRDEFFVSVPTISDGDLLDLMNDHPHLLALAREWGWNETQVRDEFSAILETNGHKTG